MATNRMSELQGRGGGYSDDIESSGGGFGSFLDEVSHIKGRIKEIEANVQEINSLKKSQAWNDDDEGADGRLEELLEDTNRIANEVRNRLKRLNQENKQMDSGDPDLRTRRTQLGGLVRSFQSTIQNLQKAEEQYRDKYKDRVKRQAKIVDPDISDRQVEEMIERGDNPQQAFASAILDDQRHNEAKNALVYIQEQHRDIQKLEKSIVELHQLFVDMNALVEAQQDMLDSIDKNVQTAVSATAASYETLRHGEQHAISARKKCCIICCIIIVVILVIVGAIAGVVAVVIIAG
eukprot:TRINITY_DN2158_c0_g1_i1.p1 TRINITY_DN2158_c0_g1~~TRINITY_DN2158_c0_g1_i1.p1  ORF type:complete len:306 (-),score=121.44 TRINITY_DN2158_c0_g1_i1:160-1035(-)